MKNSIEKIFYKNTLEKNDVSHLLSLEGSNDIELLRRMAYPHYPPIKKSQRLYTLRRKTLYR